MSDIQQAKRLIAANSIEGLRILGADVSRPCFAGRYNRAAEVTLADPQAQLTAEERRLIASFIEPEEPESRMEFTLRVRLSLAEKDTLDQLAQQNGMDVSTYVRKRLFG